MNDANPLLYVALDGELWMGNPETNEWEIETEDGAS